MGSKVVNTIGEVSITDDVIATLSGLFTIQCYGIVGMASKRATDGLVELLGKDNLSRGVKVYTQDEHVVIDVFIVVQYGISIITVARNVIETVKYNIENLTGLKVDKVNVTVEGVRV